MSVLGGERVEGILQVRSLAFTPASATWVSHGIDRGTLGKWRIALSSQPCSTCLGSVEEPRVAQRRAVNFELINQCKCLLLPLAS